MLIRREGFGGESRRDSLARRMAVVAEIRRRETYVPTLFRRHEELRLAGIQQHKQQPGQDAA
jgi:hypothetical protein